MSTIPLVSLDESQTRCLARKCTIYRSRPSASPPCISNHKNSGAKRYLQPVPAILKDTTAIADDPLTRLTTTSIMCCIIKTVTQITQTLWRSDKVSSGQSSCFSPTHNINNRTTKYILWQTTS